MRKLILFNMATIDGHFAGPSGELDWHTVDRAFMDFSIEQLNEIDILVFGRKTYELMADYWTKSESMKNDPIVAGHMNRKPKLVASRKLKLVEWSNSSLIKGDIVEKMREIKKEHGKDMIILGSAEMASTLINSGLIDEFRLMISPVILGNGRPQFQNISDRIKLKLLRCHAFESGNVLLAYGKTE